MKSVENECLDCKSLGMHCIGLSCPNRSVTRYYCDECGQEDTLYDTEYGELCAECLLDKFRKVEGSEW